MKLSPARLHPAPAIQEEHYARISAALYSKAAPARVKTRLSQAPGNFTVPVTAISIAGNFDSYIGVWVGSETSPVDATTYGGEQSPCVIDSGNSALILPYYEVLSALPDFQQLYTNLGTVPATGPQGQTWGAGGWGCPATVLKGPIMLSDGNGNYCSIPDVVFLACTGDNASGRTSNFGSGVLTDWAKNGWYTQPVLPDGVAPLQAPISYSSLYSCVQFNFELPDILSMDGSFKISENASITLSAGVPQGWPQLPVVPDIEWMAVELTGFGTGSFLTQYPSGSSSIAAVDSGGGPVNFTDSTGCVWPINWPLQVPHPNWRNVTWNDYCSTADSVTMQLTGYDGSGSVLYTIDTPQIPQLKDICVMLAMRSDPFNGWNGLNIGGVSCLIVNFLIDYANSSVGFLPQTTSQPESVPLGLSAAAVCTVDDDPRILLVYQEPTLALAAVPYNQGEWHASQPVSGLSAAEGSPLALVLSSDGSSGLLYYVDAGSVIQQATLGNGQWTSASTQIPLPADSGLAAIAYGGNMNDPRLYFVDNSGTLWEFGPGTTGWTSVALSTQALPNSCVAAVAWITNDGSSAIGGIRVYYQAEDTSINEYCWQSGSNWWAGKQFATDGASGTAIAACFASGIIDVSWQNPELVVQEAHWNGSNWTETSVPDADPIMMTGLSAANSNGTASFFLNATPQSITQGQPTSGGSWTSTTISLESV